MPTNRRIGRLTLALVTLVAPGCATFTPFSANTPAMETLRQEESYFYSPAAEASRGLGDTPLRVRVQNVMTIYGDELGRARDAQGGFLNATLSIFGLVLPISGTVSTIALSNPDHIETVGIVTGAATTAVMALSLLLKPEAKSQAAARVRELPRVRARNLPT